MRLQFVTIGQIWKDRAGEVLHEKKARREIMTLALARVIIRTYWFKTFILVFKS